MVVAAPKVAVETSVTITMPAGTARVLYEMFNYQGIADAYRKYVSGEAISIPNIERTVEDLKDALSPALGKLDAIDKAVAQILRGKKEE